MVSIVIVLAAVVWIFVSGMMDEPDEEKITVTMSQPEVQLRSSVYDAAIHIYDVAPNDRKVVWSEVYVVVKAHNGSALNQSCQFVSDDNATYHDFVEFWYVDLDENDTKVNTGDAIKITGMSTDYEGATITLTRGGERIGEVTLPVYF
jgi:FlaG/FlaF family flagellin (archaellin)